MNLDSLTSGQTADILEVVGDDVLAVRLMEIGFVDGQRVQRTGQAPMGDPIEYSLGGCRVSLRRAEAARVRIQLTE